MTAQAAQESGLAKEFISGINSDENAVMRDLYLTISVVQRAIPAALNMGRVFLQPSSAKPSHPIPISLTNGPVLPNSR